jgi:hypothetical protein
MPQLPPYKLVAAPAGGAVQVEYYSTPERAYSAFMAFVIQGCAVAVYFGNTNISDRFVITEGSDNVQQS